MSRYKYRTVTYELHSKWGAKTVSIRCRVDGWDNRFNDPLDPDSGILGTVLDEHGRWQIPEGYSSGHRYPGDPAYLPNRIPGRTK